MITSNRSLNANPEATQSGHTCHEANLDLKGSL